MIPTIIYLLLRTYKRNNPVKAERLAIVFRKINRMLVILIALMLICYYASPQTTQLKYNVKRKGSQIGSISFSQQNSGNKKVLRIDSEIKARILFLFTAIGQEESVYENGIMVWSSIYQQLNGSERMNKKTMLKGRNYVVTKGKHSDTIGNYPISYNMICLYASEPINVSKVYSDSFQEFLNIQTIGDHDYKIVFPDGNYNEYYYNNGLCTRVEVHHRLYRSSFELKN